MAVTYPRELPDLSSIQSILRRYKTTVGVFEPIFSGIRKKQKYGNQRWEVEYTIIPLNRADMDVWWSWVVSLNGKEQNFYGILQAPNEVKGSAKNGLNPQLNGDHEARVNSVNLTAGTINSTGYLKAGDIIQLGTTTESRLHMVLEDVNTDGTGEASFDIWPDTQAAYGSGATVTVLSPKGVFSLNQNSVETIQDGANTIKGLRFTASGEI